MWMAVIPASLTEPDNPTVIAAERQVETSLIAGRIRRRRREIGVGLFRSFREAYLDQLDSFNGAI
jgi:hypothetical protein